MPLLLTLALLPGCTPGSVNNDSTDIATLARNFDTPPADARPGVYWYFMDGNLSREGMTKDLEAMREAGIGYVVFLEVNVGVPRGKVDFMSEEWMDTFAYMVRECRRLGIKIVLGIGPGWTGSGGPWVEGEESMQHLVASEVKVEGGKRVSIHLDIPDPNPPYFGEGSFTPDMRRKWQDFYRDEYVLAYPTPENSKRIPDIQEKGLFIRHPYSSMPGVRPYFDAPVSIPTESSGAVNTREVIDISEYMSPDGTLVWDAPEGEWTILRMGARNNGAATRPAPTPGVGMEADKFSAKALENHLANFTGKLFERLDTLFNDKGGIELLHLDSWEMGAQNWNAGFREEFTRRRGYDPLPWLPAYTGAIVGDSTLTERFLWDVRRTAQELVVENHVGTVMRYAHEKGLKVSIEPYDMNPTADLELAAAADMPMAEFWSDGYGFNTSFAQGESSSAAHLIGQNVVPAESFTSHLDAWRQHPGSIKNQTDWAFCSGINRLMFHTFQHQCLPDSLRPGMTMGPYGVHWDRGQTWWDMSIGYHTYVARCQYLLQRGRTVADILYLVPENSPFVFRAPVSAYFNADGFMPDRKGHNFDACPPSLLSKAKVRNGKVSFPSGAEYSLLVLPDYPTATPALLKEVLRLVDEGATVTGFPFKNSPSLQNYPSCDEEVRELSARLLEQSILCSEPSDNLYPSYSFTSGILREMGVEEDFSCGEAPVRYTHRTLDNAEIYFISNTSGEAVEASCPFRVCGLIPEIWDPMSGERYSLAGYSEEGRLTTVNVRLEANEGLFVVFSKTGSGDLKTRNMVAPTVVASQLGEWDVSFDPIWGGPAEPVKASSLFDWSRSDKEEIRYYSGKATYRNVLNIKNLPKEGQSLIDLGEVDIMARVRLNGTDLGITWTSPFVLDTKGVLKEGENQLEIEVVNLWQNRIIGDERLHPYDGPEGGRWPEWLEKGEPRSSGRITFTTWRHYGPDDPLLPSGLLGPVRILSTRH